MRTLKKIATLGSVRNYDPTDIRGQENAKADTDLRSKLAKDTEESDFMRIMGSKWGRRIVARIIARSRAGDCCFNPNALTMSFASGRQVEGEYQERLAKRLCPDNYLLMLKESSDEQRDTDDGS